MLPNPAARQQPSLLDLRGQIQSRMTTPAINQSNTCTQEKVSLKSSPDSSKILSRSRSPAKNDFIGLSRVERL
jgi:hypothetical protein